jgi:hypothetical protein
MNRSGVRDEVKGWVGGINVKVLPAKNIGGTSGIVDGSEFTEDVLVAECCGVKIRGLGLK